MPSKQMINEMMMRHEGGGNSQTVGTQQATDSEFRQTAEDLNDRLIESPKQRQYVPLLSKKLNKNNTTNSSENVDSSISASKANAPVSATMYENHQPPTSNNPRHQIASSPLDLTAMEFPGSSMTTVDQRNV